MRRPVGDAGIAFGRPWLAAIVRGGKRQQVHLRADREIVVQRDVERHAETVDQRPRIHIHADQVMHVRARNRGGAQHCDEIVQPFRGQRQQWAGMQRRHGQRRPARRVVQQQHVGAAFQPSDQLVDVPLHPATELVRQHQHHRQVHLAEQGGGDGEAERRHRVRLDVTVDEPGVIRIAPGEGVHRLGLALVLGGAEADPAFVEHERVAGQTVRPAALAGAHAEVVFLAVAAAERLGVEAADRVQRGTADIHAGADRGRDRDAASGIHRAAGGIDRSEVEAERQRPGLVARVTADRRVVGERRCRCHLRRRVGLRCQPPEPARRHLGITVQQRYVMPAGRLDAAIRRRDEAEVAAVAQHGDAPCRRQGIEPRGQVCLRRVVVHHDHPSVRPIRIGQHALQAAPRFIQAAIGGNDHVHLHIGGAGKWGCCRRQVIGNVHHRLSGPAAGLAKKYVVQQRVAGGLGMLVGIPGGVEPRMRIAQLGGAGDHVVQQRRTASGGDVRIALEVAPAVEPAVGIAPLRGTPLKKMCHRLQAAGRHIRVARQVPLGIEEPGQDLLEFPQARLVRRRRSGRHQKMVLTNDATPAALPTSGNRGGDTAS